MIETGREMEETEFGGGRHAERPAEGDAREYLTNLRRLAGELKGAMEAIVSRELSSLRESLQVQRTLCARLNDLRQSPELQRMLQPAAKAGADDGGLSSEIEAATECLLALNGRYSALLEHSGETLRLLAGLYRGHVYPGHAGTTLAPQTATRSWYSEV